MGRRAEAGELEIEARPTLGEGVVDSWTRQRDDRTTGPAVSHNNAKPHTMPEVNSNGMILSKEEENDNEVRRGDQDQINEFGRLNARLSEVKTEAQRLEKHLEKIEDASTELMMAGGDTVLLRLGDAMFEVEEDDATEYCEKEADRQQERLDKLKEEEADILQRQDGLKKVLYSRFGKSINLET